MIYKTLTPDMLDAWFKHCQGVFQLPDDTYFRRHYEQDPDADPSMIFVAVDGDVIASTVRVFRRTVWMQGRAVRMGGIGEVSTKPAYRGQGLASMLLAMAIAAMNADGIPLSILFGDQRIYSLSGWRFCDVPRTLAPAHALPMLPGTDAVIRPFEDGDLPALMGIYDSFAGRMDGAVLRSEAYWQQWVPSNWQSPTVLLHEGRPAAYCCYRVDAEKKILRVQEMGAAPQADPLLEGLLWHLTTGQGCTHALFHSALLPHIQGEDATQARGMMVRVNAPIGDIETSDEMVAVMRGAGMFETDGF